MSNNSKASPFIYILSGLGLGVLIFQLVGFATPEENIAEESDEKDQKIDLQYQEHLQENYKVFSLATPTDLTFGGQEVPFDNFDVKERLDRELLVNTYWHSNTFLMFKRANRWFPVIEPILEANGIPDDFKYLALIESGLTNVVSPAGATGFWQFLKVTGKEYNLRITEEIDERYHVEKATKAACDYLNNYYKKYNDWALVAASYNMGPGRVDQHLRDQQIDSYWDMHMNQETARYVYRILAVKEIMNNPDQYGFVIRPKDLYDTHETQTITVSESIPDLMQFAKEKGTTYKVLKTLNPWLRKSSLTNSKGRTYEIKLPKN